MFLKGAKTDSQVAQMVKSLPVMQETHVQSLGWEVSLEKEMATHSSILAWKILWREESGRLQSIGLHKSQTGLSNFTFTFAFKTESKCKNPQFILWFQFISYTFCSPPTQKKLCIRGINDFPRFHFRNIYKIEIPYFVFMFCSWNIKFKANFNQL